jgi:hypothetical protein
MVTSWWSTADGWAAKSQLRPIYLGIVIFPRRNFEDWILLLTVVQPLSRFRPVTSSFAQCGLIPTGLTRPVHNDLREDRSEGR